MKLTLRGHHLLCLKGFQGYGYSEDFTKNMTSINELRKQPTTTIAITNSADDICKKCPYLKNNLCKNHTQNNRIVMMDNEVISKINLSDEFNAIELFEKIDLIFNNKNSVSKICSECMWHEKCLFYKNLDKL